MCLNDKVWRLPSSSEDSDRQSEGSPGRGARPGPGTEAQKWVGGLICGLMFTSVTGYVPRSRSSCPEVEFIVEKR